MAKLRVATFNCAGLGTTARRKTIFDYLRSTDIHLLCLQETHSSSADEIKWTKEWGETRALFHSSSKNDRSNGVALLLNHSAIQFANWFGDHEGRILTADISIQTTKIHVVNIYAPQRNHSLCSRICFFDSLYSHIYSTHPTILTGDFNMVENSTLDRDPPSNRSDTFQSLQDLRSTFNLHDSFRLLYGNKRFFTRRQGQSQSRLDRFYIDSNFTAFSEHSLPGLSSDHDIVVLQLSDIHITPHGKGRWKNNTSIYLTPQFQKNFQIKWKQWRTLQPYLFLSKTMWWIHMKRRIKDLNITHAKIKRQEEQQEEDALTRQVESLHQRITENSNLLPTYHRVRKQWQNLKLWNTQRKIKKSKLDQFENDDRGTKLFFQQLCKFRKQTSITSLKNPHGQNLTDPKEILFEAQRYYQSLYDVKPTLPDAQDFFLKHIQQSLDPSDTTLMHPISSEELHHTILQMANGKSPGPDGLTVEFYKNSWNVIAQDFTETINEIHQSAYIPLEMKLGTVTLIHKKGETDLLKNYRPITLLNVDLKIYTKVLANRLKQILPNILHDHQHARPGGKIFHVLTLLRDMIHHSKNTNSDHYYLSLDFEKAFDSVDHHWLFKVLTKYGFTSNFTNVIKTLHTDATAEVLINGHRTLPFQIRRGVRQGDPLSLFLFLIATEPFLTALRSNANISGIRTPGRFHIKALSYADDITITLANTPSVTQTFFTLQNLEAASGLKLNYSKTCGLYTASPKNHQFLPHIQWTNISLDLLGSTIGTFESVASRWDKCVRNSTAVAKLHSTTFHTITAKALIVRSKILPLMTYNANVYPLLHKNRVQVHKMTERFIAGQRDCTIPISTLAQPLHRGGHSIPDIPVYCDLFYLRPIIDYVKHRRDFTPATAQIAMVEYHIGHQLSKILDFTFMNSLPHMLRPSPYYAHSLALLKKYKLNSDHLYKLSLHQLYQFLINNTRFHRPADPVWRFVHNAVLSSAHRTFNYRAIHDVLPLSTKFHTAYLDPKTVCRFCKTSVEKPAHIFFTCSQIQPIWTQIKMVISKLDGVNTLDLTYYVVTQFVIPPQLKHLEEHLTYLFSTTRYKIWTHRNEIESRTTVFSAQRIIKSIKRSIHHRLAMEKQTALQKFTRTFEELKRAFT